MDSYHHVRFPTTHGEIYLQMILPITHGEIYHHEIACYPW
jgi:hypothetical protein